MANTSIKEIDKKCKIMCKNECFLRENVDAIPISLDNIIIHII